MALSQIPPGAIPGLTLVAWAQFGYSGVVNLFRSFNVSGVVRNATGAYTITFANALPGSDYAMDAVIDSSGGLYAYMFTKAAGSVRVDFVAPGAGNVDPLSAYVAIYR